MVKDQVLDAERTELERRISEAGWHILRDVRVGDGFEVEFQQGTPEGYHLKAETRRSRGLNRNEAYRRFLSDIAVGGRAAVR